MVTDTPTIVIIDDSAEVRSLINTRLRLSPLLRVVGEGADGTAAVELAYQHQPSLLLLDMSMPAMDGLDALPGILTVSPDTRVVVYSGFGESGLAERARELGAAAFIEKSTPLDQLADELIAVLSEADAPPAGTSPPPPPAPPSPLEADEPSDDSRAASDDQSVLDEHHERFREIFDEAAIGMGTMTLTGGIVRANRALADLMMCKPDDLIGVDYGRLTCGRGDLFDSALEDINVRAANLVQLEHDVAGAPEARKVRATLAPVRDSSGQALYVFLQVQDITVQRAAEDELRRSEERFRLLVEAVEDYAIFMLSPEGIITSWNAGAQRIKGYRADEIIGQHFRVFYDPEQQRVWHPEYELERALHDGQYSEEGWRVRKDGTQFWADVVVTAIFNDAGEHIGFAKVTRNRTERRIVEQEREQARAALAAANASLETLNARLRLAAADQSQFLAVTAHELRSPVSVISGSADTLSKHWSELTSGERTELLDGMATSTERLRRFVSDLLTASRLEASALPLNITTTSLAALLDTTVDSIRAAKPGTEIIVEREPDIAVRADPDRLAQAVENLIDNALRHGAAPVRVDAAVAARTALIRVTDTGEGVDPDFQHRIFERFATRDSHGGTGLGLYIVRELARAHGGDAYFEPSSDGSSAGAFVLSVPLAQEETPTH